MEYRLGYNKISQFNKNLTLNESVVSDHAEIMLNTPYGVIAAWNISNPEHHHYFGSFESASFAKTHMFLDKSFIKDKIEDQLNYIANKIMSGEIVIFMIIEGYHSFYERLINKFENNNFTDYALVYQDIPDPDNNSAIIINRQKFSILDGTGVYIDNYYESNDREGGRERKMRIPYAFLETPDRKILVVGAVHIPGSNRRQPLDGLSKLNNIIQNALDMVSNNNFGGLVFMGDFNSIPSLVGSNVQNVNILVTEYPTHINPGRETSFYDMTIVKGLNSSKLLPIEYTSSYTQALVESINRSRYHYLKK